MDRFVVDSHTGGWASGAEVVNRDPGENFFVAPGVLVRPVAQFLVDPCEQSYRRVVQCVADGLRLRALQNAIPAAFGREPFGSLEALPIRLRIGCESVLQREQGVLGKCRLAGADHIDVRSHAALWESQADGAGNVKTPVSSLRDVFRIPELLHQLVADFGVLREAEARLLGRLGPAEVRETRGHDVEGDALVGLTEEREHFFYFKVATWPAVDKEEGDGVGLWAGLVEVVDVDVSETFYFDGCSMRYVSCLSLF